MAMNGVSTFSNFPGVYPYIHIYQPLRSGMIWHKVNFKVELNRFEFRVFLLLDCCLTKAEEPSVPYNLPITGGRIIGFIPFPMLLVLCEMQSVSSRIWTCVAVSISYDNNHYTTGTSKCIPLSHCLVSWLGHTLGWCVTPLQRYIRYNLQPKPTGVNDNINNINNNNNKNNNNTGHLISARRPDLIIINKKEKEFAKLSILLSQLSTE